MRRSSTCRRWESCCCSCLPVLVCSSGCAVLYQLAYGDGPKIEAKYAGLKGKRVAVVCVMNSSSYGDGEVSAALADQVGRILRKKVDDIDIVRQEEVSDWMDTNEWDESDFVEIGRGVKADMVLAIDVDSFSVHESKTLLKGRSHLTTTVYDVSRDGKELFRTTDYEHTFPTSHAIPVISAELADVPAHVHPGVGGAHREELLRLQHGGRFRHGRGGVRPLIVIFIGRRQRRRADGFQTCRVKFSSARRGECRELGRWSDRRRRSCLRAARHAWRPGNRWGGT